MTGVQTCALPIFYVCVCVCVIMHVYEYVSVCERKRECVHVLCVSVCACVVYACVVRTFKRSRGWLESRGNTL